MLWTAKNAHDDSRYDHPYSGAFHRAASLWAYGAIAIFLYWGWVGLILGLAILGLGVVQMGFLALVLQSQWGLVASLSALLGFTFGARFFGTYCLSQDWKG
jgi:hypothetical protein